MFFFSCVLFSHSFVPFGIFPDRKHEIYLMRPYSEYVIDLLHAQSFVSEDWYIFHSNCVAFQTELNASRLEVGPWRVEHGKF